MSDITAKINLDASGFGRGIEAAQNALTRFGQVSFRVNSILQLTSTALSGLGQMTRSAADTQMLQTSFAALVGGGSSASEVLGELRAQALSTGREFEGQAASVRKFLALGFDTAGAMKLNAALLDISGALGLTNEESQLLAVGLAQVKAKGVASMEELRQQITEKGVPVFAALQKELGYASTNDLFKAISANAIDAQLVGDENATSSAERAVRVSTLSDQLQASGGLGKSEADKIAARQVDKEIGLETIEDLRQRLRSIQALPPPEMMVIANSARSIGLGGFAKGNEKDVQREIARRHAEGNRILGEIKVILGKLQPSGAKPVEVFAL